MTNPISRLLVWPLLATAGMLTASAPAAEPRVSVKPVSGIQLGAIEINVQPTPKFRADNLQPKRVASRRDWLEVEVPLHPNGVRPQRGLIAELRVRYFIAICGKKGNVLLMRIVCPDDSCFVNCLQVIPLCEIQFSYEAMGIATDRRALSIFLNYTAYLLYPAFIFSGRLCSKVYAA